MQFRDPTVGFHRRSGRDHRFRAHTPCLARGPSRPRRARRLGVNDFWSTPLATLEKGAGDYEDYAILKYLAYWLQSRFTARLISPSRARPARWRPSSTICSNRRAAGEHESGLARQGRERLLLRVNAGQHIHPFCGGLACDFISQGVRLISGLRSMAQQPYQQQHRGYVLQESHASEPIRRSRHERWISLERWWSPPKVTFTSKSVRFSATHRSGTVSPVTEMAIPPKEWPTKTTCPGRPAISTTILSTIVPKVTFVSGVWSSP